MKTILVTGGSGFIGSNFVRYVMSCDETIKIVNLDALTYSGSPENLNDLPYPDRYTFIRGDICDAGLVAQLLRDHDIDTIVHFAAETHVDRSILRPGQFIRTNIVGTFTLLEAARQFWIKAPINGIRDFRFHHVSTDEVFGSLAPDDPPWTEKSAYDPHSPYAASKAASDQLVRAYGHTYGLPYTLSSCSNNFGPYQFPEKLIPLMILNALQGKPLSVYGNGQHIRDWIHVEDHCEALYLILKKGVIGSSYNIGGGNQTTNISIVERLCDILDEIKSDSPYRPHRKLIQFIEDRPGHDWRYALNTRKIKDELDWQPRHDLQQGLWGTVRWYLSNPSWISAIQKQKEYQNWLEEHYA